ncbi:hypothetical protein AB9_115 [Acinetobacter phage vB_AbaM_B9]|nr:hypothetical protein AB9_115 [Acinetobacter phage vB_AbaM_B9]
METKDEALHEEVLKVKSFTYVPYWDYKIIKKVDHVTYHNWDGKTFFSKEQAEEYVDKALKDRKRLQQLSKIGELSNAELLKLYPNLTHLLKEPKEIKVISEKPVYVYELWNNEDDDEMYIGVFADLDAIEYFIIDRHDVRWNLEMVIEKGSVNDNP